ncbi:MAG TPA: F0F1 ATP synthase subunit B [Mycobacteriales bacterium]|nr:F0F1 ATP synthase subunit B [Mycobacteriales bacterium]
MHPVVLAAAKEAEKTNNFLIPNFTFVLEVICFLIILWILAKFVLPPLNKRLEERQAAIRQQFEDAEKAREEAEKAQREYAEALAETRKEISRLREEANAEKAQIIDEARTEARRQAEELLEANRERLNTERQQILLSLRNEIGELAFTLSEKIVRDSLRDEDRQRKLVDDFIAGVGATAKVEAEAR